MGTLPKEKIEHLILPSTKDLAADLQDWVEINVNPLGGDMVSAMAEVGEEPATGDFNIAMLATLIKGWSYVEEDGTATPITPDNVRRLVVGDLGYLAEVIEAAAPKDGGQLPEKKDETSSKSSTPPAPVSL